ncbi:hypothetical protein ACGFK1_18330 [Mycobacterium sp. NPDC048908]|uniref:hypothetical protein n=1 Tax=Mycobacterium sp. NPDC048908 TaxID=3364292 RepID=UPI00371D5F2E
MNPVDQSVRFVELVAQAGHPATGDNGGVTLNAPGAVLRGLNLFGNFVHVRVQ